MKTSEFINKNKEGLVNTNIWTAYVTPLFTRSGMVMWESRHLYFLYDKEQHLDKTYPYLASVVLNDDEIAVMFPNHKYKHVRLFKNGCDTSFWVDDLDKKQHLDEIELDNAVIGFTTDDEDDWKKILEIEEIKKV